MFCCGLTAKFDACCLMLIEVSQYPESKLFIAVSLRHQCSRQELQELSCALQVQASCIIRRMGLRHVGRLCTRMPSWRDVCGGRRCVQEYEAVLDQWMAEFHYLLTYTNVALAESDSEKESVVDAVKAAVCDNIYLFIQINEDEFEKYLKTFAQDVWTELTKVSLNPGQVITMSGLALPGHLHVCLCLQTSPKP